MVQQVLKQRSDLHIARKLWHSIALLTVIVVFHNLTAEQARYFVIAGASIFVIGDILRLNFDSINKRLNAVFGPFMREHEKHSLAGTTSMAIGLLVIIFVFPKPVVKLAMFFTAIADPLASYFGLRYGKTALIGKKTLEGTLGAFLVCFSLAFMFYQQGHMMEGKLLIASLLSGLVGAFGELIPVGKLDDNLTFPIFSATGLFAIFHLFGALP